MGERWLCGGKVRGKGVHCIDEKIHGSFNVLAAALRWWRLRSISHLSSLGLDGTVAASMGGGVMVGGAKVVILSDFLSWIFKSRVGLLITDLAFFYFIDVAYCYLLISRHCRFINCRGYDPVELAHVQGENCKMQYTWTVLFYFWAGSTSFNFGLNIWSIFLYLRSYYNSFLTLI